MIELAGLAAGLVAWAYIAGAANWASWWHKKRDSPTRARALLATPIWFVPLTAIGIAHAYRAVSRLIVQARPGVSR